MKKLISVIVLSLVSMTSHAYQGMGLYFPNEETMEGLPAAIPCGIREFTNGMAKSHSLQCAWYYEPRDVKIWDDKRQQDVVYSNQFSGRCIKGNCRDGGGNIVGHWSADIPFAYRFGTTSTRAVTANPLPIASTAGQPKDKIASATSKPANCCRTSTKQQVSPKTRSKICSACSISEALSSIRPT